MWTSPISPTSLLFYQVASPAPLSLMCGRPYCSFRSATTTTNISPTAEGDIGPPPCLRSNYKSNTTINYYYYLKGLSGPFNLRSCRHRPLTSINTTLVSLYKVHAPQPPSTLLIWDHHSALFQNTSTPPSSPTVQQNIAIIYCDFPHLLVSIGLPQPTSLGRFTLVYHTSSQEQDYVKYISLLRNNKIPTTTNSPLQPPNKNKQ